VAGFLSWWDGVELWLSGLGFVLQTIIVMPVVLLLAYGIALVVDRVLGTGISVLRFIRHDVGNYAYSDVQGAHPDVQAKIRRDEPSQGGA